MEGEYPDLAPNTINQKITRWLNKMVEFGLIKDRGHDKYQLNRDAIKNLNLDED
jgi:hypothetical protein